MNFIKMIHKSSIKKILIVAVVIIFSYFWTSYSSNLLMHKWGWDLNKVTPTPMWIAQMLSIPLMSSMLVLAFYAKSMDKKIVGVYLGYAAWFVILFLSYAPGCMTEDTYYTFHMVKNGWWSAWYSALHPAFITALLQIFPFDFLSPGLTLSLIWAAVFALIHNILFSFNAKRLYHLLLPVLVLVPATIAASLIVIRDSFFTALFILFCLLIFKAISFRTYTRKFKAFLVGLLGALLMIYRADAIPSVILGLAALFLIRKSTEKCASKNNLSIFIALAFPIVLMFSLFHTIPHLFETNWVRGNTWESRAENEYRLTLIESPLGYIVRSPKAKVTKQNQITIEKVFKFSDLTKHYCPNNLCVFYGGFWNKNSTQDERNSAFRAALSVFVVNPKLFIESRIKTLETVGEKNAQTICSRSTMTERGFYPLKLNDALYDYGRIMVSFVQKTETVNGYLGGSKLWWNVYLWSSICLLLMLTAFWTPASSMIASLLLIRTAAVFVAAPAGFTVYYLTLFIGVPIVFILWTLELTSRVSCPQFILNEKAPLQ